MANVDNSGFSSNNNDVEAGSRIRDSNPKGRLLSFVIKSQSTNMLQTQTVIFISRVRQAPWVNNLETDARLEP